MQTILHGLHSLASGIGPFFLLLGLLIFVHELGHYLVAVYFGVRVETFSLGFGKKLFSFKRGYTTYAISLIPLGGYVKMFGDDPSAEIAEADRPHSFLYKPVWPRIAIVLAGPLMNLLFAIIVFSIVGMMGEEVPGTQLGDINENTAAYAQGFRSGDTILKIDGSPVVQWREVKEYVENHPDHATQFEVHGALDEKAVRTLTATPALKKNEFLFSTDRQVGKIEGLTTESISTMVGVTDQNSSAAKSGLKTFDIIETVNGEPVVFWRDLEKHLVAAVDQKKDSAEWVLGVRSYDSKAEEKEDETKDKKSTHEVRIAVPATLKMALSSGEQVETQGALLSQLGIARSDLFLLQIKPDSPAAKAGLKIGDRVTQINHLAISSWQEVLDRVKGFKPEEKSIAFTVVQSGEAKNLEITPEQVELPTDQGSMEKRFAIGVVPAISSATGNGYLQKYTNPGSALVYGVQQSFEWSKLIAISFLRLVQNEVSARNIGGVITIGRVASKSFEAGAVAFLKMMSIISINLFLLNLLPVPVLDGGHLLFFSIEAIKGAPVSFRKMEIAQQVGLVLLLSLMIFALFNDITHLISSW